MVQDAKIGIILWRHTDQLIWHANLNLVKKKEHLFLPKKIKNNYGDFLDSAESKHDDENLAWFKKGNQM